VAERRWGAIVNVSTIITSFGQPGMAMYGASRAALELLTKAWAAEYGPRDVGVNGVAPEPTRTPMNEGFGDMADQIARWRGPAARGSPKNSPRRSSFSRATMPASSMASRFRSTGDESQP
jgi:NAD(P)-dependent dehydrogenase (short-subunit alcohol dehydrogenase family)